MRTAWIEKRRDAIGSGANVTQLHYARRGVVTEEIAHVARRENLPESLLMEEVARGRMIIPANINHANLEPMAIGIASSCKVNANIGASPNASDINEELEKLHLAVKYGADTVMDLSTGGVNLDEVRTAIIKASPVPIGTVLLMTTTLSRSADFAIASATAMTAVRSAAPEWSIGVPTATKQMSDARTADARSVVKSNRFSAVLRRTSSSRPGS